MACKRDDHHQQERENAEPDEVRRPMPLVMVAVVVAMVIFGVVYILMSGSCGNPGYGECARKVERTRHRRAGWD